MVTLEALASAPVTIEMLVARDISAYSRRHTLAAASGTPRPRSNRAGGYSGTTGIDPAITGEPPEEQVDRVSRRPQ